MAEYQLTTWKLSDFIGEISASGNLDETVGSSLVGTSATLSTSATELTFQIEDDDALLEDAYRETGDFSMLSNDLTIDGETFLAGDAFIEAEYRLYTDDDPSVTFTVIAIGGSSSNDGSSGSKVNYLVYTDSEIVPGQTFTFSSNSDGPTIGYDTVCFTAGTLIDTPRGQVAVEDLVEGDMVLTRDSGQQPILWCGRRDFSAQELRRAPHLAPTRIRANALGNGCPSRDLLVSPQHRIAIDGWKAEIFFAEAEALVPAKALCNDHSVTIDREIAGVSYCHILLERHELVRANGQWAETLLLGPQAQETLGEAQTAEIEEVFPGILASATFAARPILSSGEAQVLRD